MRMWLIRVCGFLVMLGCSACSGEGSGKAPQDKPDPNVKPVKPPAPPAIPKTPPPRNQ
jgi:hypothetical protein